MTAIAGQNLRYDTMEKICWISPAMKPLKFFFYETRLDCSLDNTLYNVLISFLSIRNQRWPQLQNIWKKSPQIFW